MLTAGRLLWRDLFCSLSSKTDKFSHELFSKAKLLIQCSSQQQTQPAKKSLVP